MLGRYSGHSLGKHNLQYIREIPLSRECPLCSISALQMASIKLQKQAAENVISWQKLN